VSCSGQSIFQSHCPADFRLSQGLPVALKSLAKPSCRRYNNFVRISYDPDKRQRTLEERGLDFEDALLVFEGITVEIEDLRKDYGERRIICYGGLQDRLVVVGYTPRGTVRHIFSMRKANDREQTRLAPYLGFGSDPR